MNDHLRRGANRAHVTVQLQQAVYWCIRVLAPDIRLWNQRCCRSGVWRRVQRIRPFEIRTLSCKASLDTSKRVVNRGLYSLDLVKVAVAAHLVSKPIRSQNFNISVLIFYMDITYSQKLVNLAC